MEPLAGAMVPRRNGRTPSQYAVRGAVYVASTLGCREECLIRVDNKYFRVDNELIGLKVQLQYDESKIIVFRGSEQVIELDKAEDGFNPCLQAESTQGTQETAVEKRLEQLKNEPRWNEFQSCAGELNRDGKAYDVSIDWVQAEPLVNKGLEMEATE